MIRAATAFAVVLAVVATALAGVKEQSETRRLQYDIPRLERRRDVLERRLRAAEAGVARSLSAASLLTELDARSAAPLAVVSPPASPPTSDVPADEDAEGGDR